MPPGPSHTPAPYGSLHVRKRSSRWQNLPSAAGLALVACRRQPGGACTGRGRLIQLPAGLWGGGCWKSHLPCCRLAQKSGRSSCSTASHHLWCPSRWPVSWCHIFPLAPCTTSWDACRQQESCEASCWNGFQIFSIKGSFNEDFYVEVFNRRSGAHGTL